MPNINSTVRLQELYIKTELSTLVKNKAYKNDEYRSYYN